MDGPKQTERDSNVREINSGMYGYIISQTNAVVRHVFHVHWLTIVKGNTNIVLFSPILFNQR